MIITRKIELWLDEEDKDERAQQWQRLREINNTVYLAANRIVSEQFYNETIESRWVDNDGAIKDLDQEIRKLYRKIRKAENDEKKADLEKRLKQVKIQKEENRQTAHASYGTSRQNTTYRITSRDFPELPTAILTALNASVYKTINTEWKEIKRGDRALRTYRKGMPIPFQFQNEPFIDERSEIHFRWLDGIRFKLHFGRDRSANRSIVEKILVGEYKTSDSSIQIKDRKIFLLLCVRMPEKAKEERDPDLFVGVDLGIINPAYCALSKGYERLAIGHRKDLLDWRLQVQFRRRQLQKAVELSLGGKGRKKKLKALDRFRDSERNYVRTYNHLLSRKVVEFAEKHNASEIKMELLEGYGKDERGYSLKGHFLLRNWSYFELQTMIKYKADRAGIPVKYIDPYHTSQTCSKCGHYEEGQRPTQEDFVCKNPECNPDGEKVSADFNAAVNIARSEKFVDKKEDCEYFKTKHDT